MRFEKFNDEGMTMSEVSEAFVKMEGEGEVSPSTPFPERMSLELSTLTDSDPDYACPLIPTRDAWDHPEQHAAHVYTWLSTLRDEDLPEIPF